MPAAREGLAAVTSGVGATAPAASPAVSAATPAPAAGAAVACAHCALPVPPGLLEPGAARSFCCEGCRTAWTLIHDSGLERYYRLDERRGAPVLASGKSYEEFDHPAFHVLHVRARPGGLAETELYLDGVHCASCVWLVERVPLALPGLVSAELEVPRSLVRITWDATRTPLSAVARMLDTLGYPPHPFRGARIAALRRAEDRAMLVRIGVAGALAGNVMMVAVALYAGWFGAMEAQYTDYFRWVSLLLTAPALFGPGIVFFRSAWAGLRTRTLHMDLPIALALGAGFARGAVNTFTGRGPIYFDGVATLIFLLLVGRFLQQRAQRAAADSTELLTSLSPRTARVVDGDGGVREVPTEALLPGMAVEVRGGDAVPADGRVTAGATTIDQSLLSGESRPVAVSEGGEVFAGTVNRGTRIVVRVERTGEESRVGRILREVEAGAARRAPVVLTADRLAGAFVGVVLGLALVTWLVWSRLDPSVALDHAIAMLIVTCPCALALATPLAVTVAIGRAARAGILIKGGDALELLARPRTIVLDKTGTVTEGRLTLARWDGTDAVRPLVLALERHARHPIADAFVEAWPGLVPAEAGDVEVVTGRGVRGTVDGRRVVVGSPAFVAAACAGSAVTPDRQPRDPGLTPVWVALDGQVVARAGFGDQVRDDAAASLARLRQRGHRLRLLSGDDPSVVARVARTLGFADAEARGAVSPEDKQRVIEELESRERVVMVGDGVNDAAAIARASVGVGVRGGAEACLAAADVFLARPGLAPLVELVEGSAATLRVIRRNIAFSLAYNVLGAVLALTGLINPLIAAVAMPVSSLTVVLASWLGRTFGGPRP